MSSFPRYKKHMSFNATQTGHSALSSASSIKTTAKLSVEDKSSEIRLLSLADLAKMSKGHWLLKMSCHHCRHPHDHRRLKVKHYVILLQMEIFEALLHKCVFSGMLVQQIHSFCTPATHNAPFNGHPGPGSQRIQLNKQVRRTISKFGQSLNLFCTSAHESLSYIYFASPI